MTLSRTLSKDRAIKDAIIRFSRNEITRQSAESVLHREGASTQILEDAARLLKLNEHEVVTR